MNHMPQPWKKPIMIVLFILTACTSGKPQATATKIASTIHSTVLSPVPTLSPAAPTPSTVPSSVLTLSPATPSLPFLLYDDFNNPDSGWSVFGDKQTAEVGYGVEAFRIAFYRGGGFQASWSLDQYSDFTVETQFRVTAGSKVGAGLTLRTTPDNWYLLMIYPDMQEYAFSKVVSGSYHSLVDHEYSTKIQPELVDGLLYLQLKVNLYQDTFEILVGDLQGNYSLIDTIHDTDLKLGHLGPAAEPPTGSFQAPVEVLFDWIRVSRHDPQEVVRATETPGTPAIRWSQSNQDGFGDPQNISVFSLGSFKGVLYAGTRNEVAGAQIWRLENGSWEQVMNGGFGSPSNRAIDHLIEFNGYIYASTWNQYSDTSSYGAEIWRSKDGENWSQVVSGGFDNPNNGEIILEEFMGKLYAGTWSFDPTISPAEIWVSTTGDEGDWSQVVDAGFAAANNYGVITLGIYQGNLYIGTAKLGESGTLAWRTHDGIQLEPVDNHSFGDPKNHSLTAFAGFGEYLYASVGTSWDAPRIQLWRCKQCDGNDWELVKSGGFHYDTTWRKGGLEVFSGGLYYAIGNQELGMEVWRTMDGVDWEEVAFGGFADTGNIYTYFDNAIGVFGNRLYIGTDNRSTGGEIWEGILH
jgi:hypothetical protein